MSKNYTRADVGKVCFCSVRKGAISLKPAPRLTGKPGAASLGTMSRRPDFRTLVFERSRRIVRDAKSRVGPSADFADRSPEPGRGLTGRILTRLPDAVKDHLRNALGPDPKIEQGRSLLAAARRRMTDVHNRESAVEAARSELAKREHRAGEADLELRAKEARLDKRIAEAKRAAQEASTEMRVPLNRVTFNLADSPRPMRGIKRLAANIKRFGQLTPVVVRPVGESHYQLVTGYRRMLALSEAQCTHVVIRVVTDLDDATAAALYAVENCLVDGVSSNAIKHLAARIDDKHPLNSVLQMIQHDDDEAVEDIFLDEMAEEAAHHLAEGAAWVSALRPYWLDLDEDERVPLEQLILYFAKVAKRLK